MMLQTLALYSRSLKFWWSSLLFQMCLSFPKRCVAITILFFTSCIYPPPASKTEPRYFNSQELSASVSPHFTFGRRSCIFFRFFVFASRCAVLVHFFFLRSWWPSLVLCALRSCALLTHIYHSIHYYVLIITIVWFHTLYFILYCKLEVKFRESTLVDITSVLILLQLSNFLLTVLNTVT